MEEIDMNKKKALALVVISASLASSLTACSGKNPVEAVSNLANIAEVQKQPFATTQEIMDYYAQGMKYASISTRPGVKEENFAYNTVEQGTEAYEKLKNAYIEVEAEHQKVAGYKIDRGLHDFMKAFTDDMVLSGGEIRRAKEHGGYYYLTVAYDTTKNISGSFKQQANYMGIDGVIVKDLGETYKVDEKYLNYIISNQVNPLRAAENKPQLQSYGSDNTWFDEVLVESGTGMNDVLNVGDPQSEQPVDAGAETGNAEGNVDGTADGTTDTEGTSEDTTTEDTGAESADGATEVDDTELPNDPGDAGSATNVATILSTYTLGDGRSVEKTGVNNIDRLEYDINEFKAFGSSKEQIADIPPVNMVYNPAPTQGRLNGFGMYSQAKAGLSEYGITQNSLEDPGSIIVTYVFKQNVYEPEKLDYVTVYVNEYSSNNKSMNNEAVGGCLTAYLDEEKSKIDEGQLIDEEALSKGFTGPQLTVPTFLTDRLNMAIDEFDRAVNNKSAMALMDGTVIEDVGLGMKYAAYAQSADIVTFKSDIKRIVARKDNSYLLEVERTVEDCPRDTGVIGQYRDTYFVVIRQDGTKFRYNDEYLVRRVNTSVPEVDAENTAIRRLVALNLSGEVDQNTAKNIETEVLNKFTENMKTRAEDPAKFFNPDKNLLNEDRYEYIYSKIMGQANAKGSSVKLDWKIVPTEWISGTSEQVEFTTKELILYDEGNKGGLYLENYYLVSKYGTEWLIDDIITVRDESFEKKDVSAYQQRMSGGAAEAPASEPTEAE